MNPTDDNLPMIDDVQFDLLVDGELNEAERRKLLRTLDEAPDGWRCCALAFLEAQSWKKELSAIRRRETSKPRATRSFGRWFVPTGPRRTALAMAASFLIALILGLEFRNVRHPESQTAPGSGQLAGVPHGPAVMDPGQEEPRDVQPDKLPLRDPVDAPWQTVVSLPVGSGPEGSPRLIQLPATERKNIDETWLESLPAAMPDELLQAFEQSGHRIQRERRLLPFSMKDGRQLVVPVDQVEIRYVNNPAYQ